ncbi:metallophosphoesterase [Lacinutrix neustonica]|uniref:metallophosphoesterase n=1 Tax=Lacinutrix neustonica TaxID=2980107 RepID=UPI0028BF1C1E|nr:metallophosphoesterase [Lacinutrix neustonica]
MTKNNIILTFIILLVCSSCATFEAQYRDEEKTIDALPNKDIERRFYLIGDAGKSPIDGLSLGLTAFEKHVAATSSKKDYVVFLGDNIYPDGLVRKERYGRKNAENALNAQINAVKNFEGNTVMIPGNHDWYADGVSGLKREEKYIENALGKNTFQPENGCPLESIEVGDKIQLIVIDTQWYLENWNHNPTINDECEIKTRERFFEELEGELKKAQNKRVVFAMHHPMYTNGTHGGFFDASKHLFPTQRDVPVPVLASLLTQVRTQGGVSIQDRYNERYNELMNRIETMALEYDNIVFASRS